MQTEEELKRLAKFLEQKVDAVALLNDMKQEHTMKCPYEDMTGYPAPCTCGAEKINLLVTFIKRTVLKATRE